MKLVSPFTVAVNEKFPFRLRSTAFSIAATQRTVAIAFSLCSVPFNVCIARMPGIPIKASNVMFLNKATEVVRVKIRSKRLTELKERTAKH